MRIVSRKIESLKQFDPKRVILEYIASNRRRISRYVSEMQLFTEGVRGGDGELLENVWSYHPYTIAIKQAKGQPTDRVTLRDTGAFHRSIDVAVDDEKFEITASDPKTDALMEKYGEGILALSDAHLRGLKYGLLLPELRKKLRQALS